MPLHLLGKKSWNVYNADNIARVRRDEEAAQAREEAEEQRQQAIDSERRLAILRGEAPPPLPPPESPPRSRGRGDDRPRAETSQGWGKERRKRRRPNEDETDFELRLARERASAAVGDDSRDGNDRTNPSKALVHKSKSSSNAPLIDASGHIDLFPVPSSSSAPTRKNPEAEAEAARKKREYEDQYTLRFSNAAGFKQSLSGPWYASAAADPKELVDREIPGKDVWGNEDPRKKDREAARIVSSDPLAMMKRGAAKVREVEKERRELNEERDREIIRLHKEERKRGKRRRRDEDDLEDFSLDGPARDSKHRRSDKEDATGISRHKHRHSRRGDERRDGGSQHRHRHLHGHHSSRRDDEIQNRHSDGRGGREKTKTDHF